MAVSRCFFAAIFMICGVASLPAKSRAADSEATEKVLDGVRWVGPAVSLEGLRGKTVLVIDYATWCPKCNKWSGEVCQEIAEIIRDKPVIVLAINNDPTPGNVKPYLEARGFFAPNILHGYDRDIAKRNGLEDLWGYMLINPEGKITNKGQVGSFYPGADGGKNAYVLPQLLRKEESLGEFVVLDPKMPDEVKDVLWPMELGRPLGADIRKLSGDVKQQIKTSLNKYGEKQIASLQKLAEGEAEGQLAAYDRAKALREQVKWTDAASSAKQLVLDLESKPGFKRELNARTAYLHCEKMPANTSAQTAALRNLAKNFDGTFYGTKAKEAFAALKAPAKTKS